MHIESNYEAARQKMQTGDVIAFLGVKGRFSKIITAATSFSRGRFSRSQVSHVGMVRWTDEDRVCIVESTTMTKGRSGVQDNYLSERIDEYASAGGSVWWLRLNTANRRKLMRLQLNDFLLMQDGKPYDGIQAILSGLEQITGWNFMPDIMRRWYCSELVAAGLRAGQVLPPDFSINLTPIELCRTAIFHRDLVQLAGPSQTITDYNTIPVQWPGKENVHVEVAQELFS